MTANVSRRKRPRGEFRRGEILNAATQVFLENGYAGATIDVVVARAGASKATIYGFFGGKEGLFAAIVEKRSESIVAAFLDIDVDGADVTVALTQIGRRFMDDVMRADYVAFYRLIISEGGRHPEMAQTYRLAQGRVYRHLAGILADWRQRGLIDVSDPELTAIQFLESVRGGLFLQAMVGVTPDDLAAAIERNIENAVQIFWSGVGRQDGDF